MFSHGSSNSAGVAILIRNGFDFTLHSVISDPSGRYIIVKANIEDKQYVLVNIYMLLSNKDKDLLEFFRSIQKLICDKDFDNEENIIIGGDFNCPIDPLLNKKRWRSLSSEGCGGENFKHAKQIGFNRHMEN